MDSVRNNPGYGVALWDDPDISGQGLICLAGEAPRRIASPADVPSHNVYISNMDYRQFVRARLQRTPKFRARDFLRLNLGSILTETGYLKGEPEAQAIFLSGLFSQIMDYAARHLGIHNAPRSTLALGLREALGYQPPDNDPELEYILKSASQGYTFSAWDPDIAPSGDGPKPLFIIFREHRQAYAQSLLAAQVPHGAWRQVRHKRNQGQDALMALIEAVAAEQPVAVPIRIHRFTNSRIGNLINYGAGARDHKVRSGAGHSMSSPNQREWICFPEFLMLREFADIEICTPIMAAAEYTDNLCRASEPDGNFDPFKLQGLDRINYSAGLYLENLWTSISRQSVPASPAAMWLQALDRMQSFLSANKLLAHPDVYRINGFSHGRIWAFIDPCADYEYDQPWPEALQEQITDIALDTGLIPPMLSPARQGSPRYKRVMAEMVKIKQKDQRLSPDKIEMMSMLLGAIDNIHKSDPNDNKAAA